MTLSDSTVATRLPAQDLDRARAFYAEKLGLEPVDERPGGLLYRVAGGEFADIEGNYPSKRARGERAAWFRDSEGNMLGIGQPVR
jgi:catechol 2,3-dioxygenase-like lactoylglutathione lyase family enzyme